MCVFPLIWIFPSSVFCLWYLFCLSLVDWKAWTATISSGATGRSVPQPRHCFSFFIIFFNKQHDLFMSHLIRKLSLHLNFKCSIFQNLQWPFEKDQPQSDANSAIPAWPTPSVNRELLFTPTHFSWSASQRLLFPQCCVGRSWLVAIQLPNSCLQPLWAGKSHSVLWAQPMLLILGIWLDETVGMGPGCPKGLLHPNDPVLRP